MPYGKKEHVRIFTCTVPLIGCLTEEFRVEQGHKIGAAEGAAGVSALAAVTKRMISRRTCLTNVVKGDFSVAACCLNLIIQQR